MSPPPEIKMYRTRGCPFCHMAADLLQGLGIEFAEVFLDDHPNRREVTEQILPGHHTVPLIVIGDQPIGGFTELRSLHSSGGLDAILKGED